MYQDCYLRFSTKNYSNDNLDDKMIHLTNHQVQKHSNLYNQTDIVESQWSCPSFFQHLKTHNFSLPNEPMNRHALGVEWSHPIQARIADIVVQTVKSWPKTGGHRPCSFELLGFDLLVDSKGNVWLLEVNTNPGLHLLTEIVRPHHTRAQLDLLKLVLEQRPLWETQRPPQLPLDQGWKLVYYDSEPPSHSIRCAS
jgi:hypothetical protein